MSFYNAARLATQNGLLMKNLTEFYGNRTYLNKMLCIINGESRISLRIVDWFVTNYAKKYYTIYDIAATNSRGEPETVRFKVYNDYKLKLKAYSKLRLDPFCRWDRITIPYDDSKIMETTIGQLNFFKWAIETKVLDYIENNYVVIESDMNERNSTSRRKSAAALGGESIAKTRKKREELSESACKCIKKEDVRVVVKF
jgi:hypothetical protein